MGLLRWLLWPRRAKDDDEEQEPRGKRARGKSHRRDPGVYRIEVDGEERSMRGEGPPFSFWGSSRVILILSFLLWWIQPAGPMIAGYVGGRRAGSPMKAVFAALLPVFIIFAANAVYSHNLAAQQIDFVASLPTVVGDGAASILPFLTPYKEFLVAYMVGFVKALQSTFGMGTNGYLMVIIFAYIGGLIAEQTRRELYFRQGSNQTVGVNLIQHLLTGRHGEDAYEEEDEELQEFRRPSRARAHARTMGGYGRHSRRRDAGSRFDDYHKLNAETEEGRSSRRVTRARDRGDDEEEVEAPVRRMAHDRHEERRHRSRAAGADEDEDSEDEDDEATARREAKEKEARRPRLRSHDEEVALQRFVERALRNYDHSKL